MVTVRPRQRHRATARHGTIHRRNNTTARRAEIAAAVVIQAAAILVAVALNTPAVVEVITASRELLNTISSLKADLAQLTELGRPFFYWLFSVIRGAKLLSGPT